MDDRELGKLREIGEDNRVTLELLRNWCSHVEVVTEGGVGLFQQTTGLPVSMCRVTCKHERAASHISMHLTENALDFHDRNCFDCEHRDAVGFPNLSYLVGERDRKRQEQAKRAEERKKREDDALAARSQSRERIFEAPNATQRSLVGLLDELDRSESDEAAHAFLEALRAVPDQVTDGFRDSIVDVVVAGGSERVRTGLSALDQLDHDPKQVASLALRAIGRREAMEEAAEIAAKHMTIENREEIKAVAPAILFLAEPTRGLSFEQFKSSHPSLLQSSYSVAPDIVQAAIEQALASESKALRSAACTAVEVLLDAGAYAEELDRLATLLIRTFPLPDDLYDGGPAASRASRLLAELLGRSPETVGDLLRARIEDPQEQIRTGVLRTLVDFFRPSDLARRRDPSELSSPDETPEPVEEIAFQLIIEIVSKVPTDDRLSAAMEFFRARCHRAVPWALARKSVPLLLGTAAIAAGRADEIGEASPLLEDPRPEPFKSIERGSISLQLRALAREVIQYVAWLSRNDPDSEERRRLRDYFVETMKAAPEHSDVLIAILLAHLGSLSRPHEMLPELYSAMTHRAVRVRSAACRAYADLCSAVSPESLPPLLHETFLVLLSDPFVAVHKAALLALSRVQIPERQCSQAFNRLTLLLSVYEDEGVDPYFLVDVLEQALRFVPHAGGIAPAVRQHVIRVVRGLQPEFKQSFLRSGARYLREEPGYGDLLLDLPITGDWGDYGSERVVEELEKLPGTEVERIADRMVEEGRLVARHRPLAVQPLLELLNWSGCPQQAGDLAQAAVEECGLDESRKPQRLQLAVYAKAMEIEEALGGGSPDVEQLVEEIEALEDEIREDDEINQSRRELNVFPPI